MDRDNGQDHIPLRDWHCVACDKPIPDSRAPNFNDDNCSCEELGGRGHGGGDDHMLLPDPTTSNPYEQTTDHNYQVPPLNFTTGPVSLSSTSTNPQDVPCPEGIQTLPMNLTGIHEQDTEQRRQGGFLRLLSNQTPDEKIAYQVYRFESAYPFQIKRFLNDHEDYPYSETFASSVPGPHHSLPNGFVSQGMEYGNVHLSILVGAKSSRRSKKSHRSSGEGSGTEQSYHRFHPLDTTHVGAWATSDGDAFEGVDEEYSSDFEFQDEFQDE